MPELPDVTLYAERLGARLVGQRLTGVRVRGPSLLRTAEPPLSSCFGRTLTGVSRLGKRLIFELEDELFLALHLMIAGRLRWASVGAAIPGKLGQAAFDFEHASVLLTEAGSHKRTQLHVLRGREHLTALDRGGLEVMTASLPQFVAALRRENHTLKRSLTDPRILSGIGNAYSDEILHRARLSPVALSARLGDQEIERLYHAAREVLNEWIERLRAETGDGFPEKVTAFREGMAVHGRYAKPCPRCGTPVQRIVYAKNETNYCPNCQTGGKLLADRALSRLLRNDWPKTLTELEEHMRERRGS